MPKHPLAHANCGPTNDKISIFTKISIAGFYGYINENASIKIVLLKKTIYA